MPELPNNQNLILGGLVACAVGLVGIGLFLSYLRRDRRKYSAVGVVSHIFVHPIKSCRGLEVSQAECVALGIKSDGVMDRSFLIIDANGTFTTARQQPSLALVAPSLSDDKQSLLINAPGMPTLTVPLSRQNGPVYNIRVWRLNAEGEDCGQVASEWLNQYLGSPGFKLVRHSPGLNVKVLRDDPKWGVKAKRHEQAVFQDLSQVHILGVASLSNLNSKLDKPVTIRNFRPNIVVEGTPVHSEDKWRYVRIGDSALMRTTHMCARCRLTTVNPETGKFIKNGNPLKTLKEYRMPSPDDPDKDRYGSSPLFGTNLAVESSGTIKLGDIVYASMD